MFLLHPILPTPPRFFFSSRRRHTRSYGDWSSDVCSSDLDAETAEFHARVRDAYLRLARAEPERVKVVETNRPVELTHECVKQIVIPFLRNRGHACDEEVVAAATEILK